MLDCVCRSMASGCAIDQAHRVSRKRSAAAALLGAAGGRLRCPNKLTHESLRVFTRPYLWKSAMTCELTLTVAEPNIPAKYHMAVSHELAEYNASQAFSVKASGSPPPRALNWPTNRSDPLAGINTSSRRRNQRVVASPPSIPPVQDCQA